MRALLVAGNWKMHTTPSSGAELARRIVAGLDAARGGRPAGARPVEVAVCPPFPVLPAVAEALGTARAAPGSVQGVVLGAQNVHPEPQGAFTGEVSAPMLAELGCGYAIVGHSERRLLFGESDELVARRLRGAFAGGLVPILCVGETRADREAGRALETVLRQWRAAVDGLAPEAVARLVVAYEPVWAIGSGTAATPEDAQVAAAAVRDDARRRFGAAAAEGLRILYGGSVSPDNVAGFTGQPDVDGALVGGASLDAARFLAIVTAA